jgi:hypothetical protein
MIDFAPLMAAQQVGCIGTSEPNDREYSTCVATGYALVEMSKIIVSGNAKGCDHAYASGANIIRPTSVRLYVPNRNHYPQHWVLGNIIIADQEPYWEDLARGNHPRYDYQSDYVKKLFQRNAGIILASDYIIALPNFRKKPWGGGTSHGMKIASQLGKPVLDISDEQVASELLDFLRSKVGTK